MRLRASGGIGSARELDTRRVEVDGRHPFGDGPKLAGEDAFAAADIEHMAAVGTDRLEDQWVVVDVVVPHARVRA